MSLTNSLEALSLKLSQLQSENASLKATVDEYKIIADSKETEWQLLQLKTINNIPFQSDLENQQLQIKMLEGNLRELQQKLNGGLLREKELGREFAAAENHLYESDDLKGQLHYLQCELNDGRDQLKMIYQQNVYLQHLTSRIAELESLLENANEEISRLKMTNENH